MSTGYPGIEPDEHGMLDLGDGQRLYWEVCGNPSGKPAVVLHGGPGSGCSPYIRSLPYETPADPQVFCTLHLTVIATDDTGAFDSRVTDDS